MSATVETHRTYWLILVAVILFFSCLLFIQQCRNINAQDKALGEALNYSDSAKNYKNKFNQQVFYNKTLEFNTRKQLETYMATNDTMKALLRSFKKLVGVTVVKGGVNIHDTVPIPFETKIPCDFKPFTVKRDCTYYHFKGTIYTDKFTLDEIKVPNKQTIAFGYKKVNLFKRELRAEITNTNPFIQITNVGSYSEKVKEKRFGLGAYVGYGAIYVKGQVFAGPSVGFALSYNFIVF